MAEVKIKDSGIAFLHFDCLKLVGDDGVKVLNHEEILTFFSAYGTRSGNTVLLSDMTAGFIYVRVVGGELYMSTNLERLIKRPIDTSYLDLASIFMMLEIGFVIPPYTLFRDIFRLWPHSTVKVSLVEARISISVESEWWKPVATRIDYRGAVEELREALSQAIVEAVRGSRTPVAFTVSGGIDSSILLKIGADVLPLGEIYAMTTRSPGQDQEFQRAQAVSRVANVAKHFVLNGESADRSIEREYLHAFGEPIFDPVVSVQTRMIRQALRDWRLNELMVIEGQCADSMFLGLPHNLAMELYQEIGHVLRTPGVLLRKALSSIYVTKGSRIGRSIYRLGRMVSVLSERTPIEAFLASLGVVRSFGDRRAEYIERIRSSFECVLRNTGSLQRAVGYFFMYRVIPVREMQKYRLLTNEHVRFVFPFIAPSVIDFALSIPDEFMVRGRKRKRILFDLAKRILPPEAYTTSTSPFYVGRGDAVMMDLSFLERHFPTGDAITTANRRISDREAFETSVRHLKDFLDFVASY